jgi:hypothetical protein
VRSGVAPHPVPGPDEWKKAYYPLPPQAAAEYEALQEAAQAFRAAGDHSAAGAVERDGAAVVREAQRLAARDMALRRACGCTSCRTQADANA